jgi:hypothetical protein
MRNITVTNSRLVRRLAYALRDGNVRKAARTRMHLIVRAAAMVNEVARDAIIAAVLATETAEFNKFYGYTA